MQYGLTRVIFEESLFLELSSDEYELATTAMQNAHHALAIEEKFNLALENFEEFEGDLLSRALHESLFETDEWSARIGELHRINRKLVNLLATCRLYVDQIRHNLHTVYGKGSAQAEAFEKLKSHESDSHLGYRVLEALRNYVQHRSLPIEGVSHQSHWRHLPGGSFREHTVIPEIEPARLREDGDFKASVLLELEALGARVDIRPLAREYMASLGRVQKGLRDLMAPDVERWDAIVADLEQRFRSLGAQDLIGLAVVVREGDEPYAGVVQIFSEPIERRRWLQRENQYLMHYEHALVASRPTG